DAGGGQLFIATVLNASDPSISDWQVNGISGGNATVGTIVSQSFDTAQYSAPVTVPNPNTVTIAAVSEQDPTAKGTASVTIQQPQKSIVVTPPGPVSVMPGATVQFSAQVNNLPTDVVNWTLSGPVGGCNPSICGTITAQTNNTFAFYTAPQNVP